jgi:hypothetical protein
MLNNWFSMSERNTILQWAQSRGFLLSRREWSGEAYACVSNHTDRLVASLKNIWLFRVPCTEQVLVYLALPALGLHAWYLPVIPFRSKNRQRNNNAAHRFKYFRYQKVFNLVRTELRPMTQFPAARTPSGRPFQRLALWTGRPSFRPQRTCLTGRRRQRHTVSAQTMSVAFVYNKWPSSAWFDAAD